MKRMSLSHFGMALASAMLAAVPATASKPKAGRFVNPLFFRAPECVERPEFLDEHRTEIVGGLTALPKTVLVAREAEMWVEGRADEKAVKLHAYQSFVQPKTRSFGKVLCGSTPENFADRFSLMAPTLIDSSKERKVGDSVWQFQVIADHQGYSVWNKKSPSSTLTAKLDGLMKDQRASYRLYQIGHNEYELVLQKEDAGTVQTLSVRYEAVR